jgi:phospholipase/carboxylesterase
LSYALDPEASLLSPRGKVLERGVTSRFFRRLAEGVFDIRGLKFRTNELADFVERPSTVYAFYAKKVMAIGYSNGANIAASILLLRPHTYPVEYSFALWSHLYHEHCQISPGSIFSCLLEDMTQ